MKLPPPNLRKPLRLPHRICSLTVHPWYLGSQTAPSLPEPWWRSFPPSSSHFWQRSILSPATGGESPTAQQLPAQMREQGGMRACLPATFRGLKCFFSLGAWFLGWLFWFFFSHLMTLLALIWEQKTSAGQSRATQQRAGSPLPQPALRSSKRHPRPNHKRQPFFQSLCTKPLSSHHSPQKKI